MSIIQGNAKQASTRGFYNFPLEQSLRFNDDDTAYLSWTPASASDQDKWTWSGWVKRADINTESYLFSAGTSSTELFYIQMRSDSSSNVITIVWRDGSTTTRSLVTDRVFRDPSAWYHIVLSVDTANATTAHKMRLYINSVEITDFSADSRSTLSASSSLPVNSADLHTLGRYAFAASGYLDGYMAEVNFIDGTALDADSFGELKNGVWIPKDPSGLTYGTNGFRLSFADDAEVEAFNTVLWRGNGATQSVTGMGFQPDLVWIKERDGARQHHLYDAVRGATKVLFSSLTNAESTNSTFLTSFDSDGFTVGSDIGVNGSGQSFVGWGWKAGDSNVSNTDGSITSTVRANDTYGFSMVAWDAPSSGATTVGHGLSSAPSWVICKIRNVAANWQTWHTGLTDGTYTLFLNSDIAQQVQADAFGAVPTSSVLNIGSDFSGSGRQNIAYCWAEKSGYSKFGSYEGNNTATGPTVTTTFKPALVIIKNADGTGNWNLFDNTRATFPDNDLFLRANLSAAEVDGSAEGGDAYEVEFTDTGFIPKASGASSRSQVNGTGTYIYAAFADTREAAFWLDQSGNDNDWQPVNLDHNDTVADSPTDNFATLNALVAGNVTLSDGNLKYQHTGSWTTTEAYSTIAIPEGLKFYFEVFQNSVGGAGTYCGVGITSNTTTSTTPYNGVGGWVYLNTGAINHDSSTLSTQSSYTTGDTIGVAVDRENGTVKFYKNNTLEYTVSDSDISTGDLFFTVFAYTGTMTANFGQQPFKYDPPA